MKILALTLTLVLSLSTLLQGQSKKDALVLKNGSVIKGRLVEVSPESYSIKTSDGSILVYPADQVEGYKTAAVEAAGWSSNKFGIGFEAGFLIGTQTSEYVAPFSFTITGIYRATDIHSFSVGSGVEYLGEAFSPLFIEYSANLLDRPATPFLFIRGGAEIYTGGKPDNNDGNYYSERDYSGGPTFTIGTGINWQRESYDMILSFAFRYIKTEYSIQDYNSNESNYITNWRRLEVKLGFRF
ncbi:MAG: hypothetical protein E4G95_01610 [Bacteroidia bacterium]|nr:MAG: hypothetical protein E4G95_01610 [Bacteroidia bacterium]